MKNVKELADEFELKALGFGLHVDCPADGLFNGEIAIVAEAPGDQEVKQKSPLVGGSGRFLWTLLRKHGVLRSDVYVTNAAKRQISFGEKETRIPLGKHEQEKWYELLQWELQQLPNLRIIVALGNHALKALTGHEGIEHWRGSVLDIELGRGEARRNYKLLASFNPAYVTREPKTELIFNSDLSRIKRIQENRWGRYDIDYYINPSPDDAIDYIRSLRADARPVSVDIETMGGETACVGVTNHPHRGMCINFRTQVQHRFTTQEEVKVRSAIEGLLTDPNVPKVGQNWMFDASWLWFKDAIKSTPAEFDTMLAHHCLYPLMPHNLGYICTQYTTHPYYKDEKNAWREGGDIDTYWKYNIKDVCITLSAAGAMQDELDQAGLSDFFYNHIMRLQPHLIRMVVGGVKIDTTLRSKINDQLREDLEAIKGDFFRAVHEATGDDEYYPNPLSSQQVHELLFNRLRLVGRGPSTDDENRQRMYKDYRTSDKSRRVLDTLDTYKEESKFYSTYIVTATDDDGRMRCEYKQTGVSKAPGRLSSAKTSWGHYDVTTRELVQHGANLQNQPQRAYEMYIADEDYTFVYFDGSQAEARYVGWDVPIPKWIEQFERARIDGSYDAHRALASEMFKVPYAEVPTRDEIDGVKTIRYIAKRCRHGLNYRMMADRLASTTGLPLQEAQRAFELYHRTNPELRPYWRRLEEEARSSRVLFNSFGRRLFIQGRLDDKETLESIVAFRPQSTVGDKVSSVIYQSESDDKWPKEGRMALNVHDALIGLMPISKAKTAVAIMKHHMEQPILVRADQPPLIIPADIGIAIPDERGVRRWSTITKVKDLDSFDLNQVWTPEKS